MVNRHTAIIPGTGLHDRSAPVSTQEEAASSPCFQKETKNSADANTNTGLDKKLSGFYSTTMKNRARIVNGAIVAGTGALFVGAYSAMNFFVILFASPEMIAKIRYIKFGMSVSGSACMFINAACIFILCVEMKYAIEHYVKTGEKQQ